MSLEANSSNRRTLTALRTHLLLTCCLATSGFALVIAVAVFAPLAAQLDRAAIDSERIVGLADHFLFLHSALWPLVFVSLVSCITAATFLFVRMRSPLVRFMRAFDAVSQGDIPDPIVIRATDYLSEEAESLNRMLVALEVQAQERAAAWAQLEDVLHDLSAQGASHRILAEVEAVLKGVSEDDPAAAPKVQT